MFVKECSVSPQLAANILPDDSGACVCVVVFIVVVFNT